jgi:hypothetical protein
MGYVLRLCAIATTAFFLGSGATMSDENNSGGDNIIRYQAHAHQFRSPETGGEHVDELTKFLQEFLGPNEIVWHEIVSDKVHVDVLPFPPTADRPFWTFVTSGMSDLPMNVPESVEDADDLRYAEMVISLPAEWFEPGDFADYKVSDFTEDKYWPIALIKFLARFPHEYESWLAISHSMPNFDPPMPYASNTTMNGVVLLPPVTWPTGKQIYRMRDGRLVNFLAAVPVYADEMAVKLHKGIEAMADAFDSAGITEVLDTSRTSVVKKRGWFGLWRN